MTASDASNEQKFTNSSTCLKFIAFKQIQTVGRENTAETRNICSGNKLKVICSLDLLLQLFAQKCGQPRCQLPTTVDRTVCGTSVFIKWKCAVGHNGKFWGSHKVNESWQVILKQVILSFAQVERFANFLGLTFVSKSTFCHAQRVYHISQELMSGGQNTIIS